MTIVIGILAALTALQVGFARQHIEPTDARAVACADMNPAPTTTAPTVTTTPSTTTAPSTTTSAVATTTTTAAGVPAGAV
ncbi:MAG: hypothetical protein ACRDWA_17510, partial [Acidimicrobiia bacterium]